LEDSTTDVAYLKQTGIILRYIQIDPKFKQNIVIKESFIGIYIKNKGNAESICNFMIKMLFKIIGLNKLFMVGQGFDGANVTSGKHG
jgi:hypothetical protein